MDNGKRRGRKLGLETVPEQPSSTSPSSRYSQGSNVFSPYQRSTQRDESFVFPSANISQEYLQSSKAKRSTSPNSGARNFGFSSQFEDNPLIDFNEYGSGYSIHVDSSPDSKPNGRVLNNYRSSGSNRTSPPDEHSQHSQFTRRDLRRQGIKRSKGDLSQRSSQEMHSRHSLTRKERLYDDDDDDDWTTSLVHNLRPTSPPGVYPPQFKTTNFTPPEKDHNVKNYGSINSISSLKEDHEVTSLL